MAYQNGIKPAKSNTYQRSTYTPTVLPIVDEESFSVDRRRMQIEQNRMQRSGNPQLHGTSQTNRTRETGVRRPGVRSWPVPADPVLPETLRMNDLPKLLSKVVRSGHSNRAPLWQPSVLSLQQGLRMSLNQAIQTPFVLGKQNLSLGVLSLDILMHRGWRRMLDIFELLPKAVHPILDERKEPIIRVFSGELPICLPLRSVYDAGSGALYLRALIGRKWVGKPLSIQIPVQIEQKQVSKQGLSFAAWMQADDRVLKSNPVRILQPQLSHSQRRLPLPRELMPPQDFSMFSGGSATPNTQRQSVARPTKRIPPTMPKSIPIQPKVAEPLYTATPHAVPVQRKNQPSVAKQAQRPLPTMPIAMKA